MKKNHYFYRLLFSGRLLPTILFVLAMLTNAHPLSAQNLLVNGDFSQPEGVGFTTDYTVSGIAGSTSSGNYAISTNPKLVNAIYFYPCTVYGASGNVLVFDGATNSATKVWQVLPGGGLPVTTGTTYIFSYWAESVSSVDEPGNLGFLTLTYNGTTIAPTSGTNAVPWPTCDWQQVTYTFTATSNYAQLWINDLQVSLPGNDFALADISLIALPTATISGTTTICSGTAATISFSGTPNATVTYTVNSGANQTILLDGTGNATLSTGNLTGNATYSLVSASVTTPTLTSNSLTGSAIVTVNALPTATIGGTTTICSGAGTTISFNGTPNATVTYTINGGANQTVLLNGSGTASVLTGNLTTNTTYSLVSIATSGTSSCTQIATGNAVVTVNALPTATINGTTTICSNTATTILFSGTPDVTVTYTINGGSDQTIVLDGAGNATLPTGNLTSTTTYSLVSVVSSGTPACSQAQTGSAIVTVNPLPTVTISGSATVCSGTGTNIAFNGTPNGTVTYTINGGADQTVVLGMSGTGTVATGALTATATYSLVNIINSGTPACSNAQTGSAVVAVQALPTALISGTATIASGSSTTIGFSGTPNAAVTYTVNGGTNQTITLDGTGNATLSTGNLTSNTTYSLVSVTGSGTPSCTQPQSGSAIITVVTGPTAAISGTTTICSGTSATISFTGTPNATVTYTINGGADQTIVLDGTGNATLSTGNLTSTTTYSLVSASVTAPIFASNLLTGTATVTVNALSTATINGTTTICFNTAATILFSGTPNATVTYTINGGANQTISLDGTGNGTLPTGNLTLTTTYALVSVANPGSAACVQPVGGTAVVTVTGLPTATINGATTICANTATTILFSGTPNATVTYTINGGANQTITLDGTGNATMLTGNLTSTTTYALVSVANPGSAACVQPASGTAIVTVTALPIATITGTTTICSNTSTTISFSGTPNATVTYTINGGANQTITLDGTGNATMLTGNLTSTTTYALVSVANPGSPACVQPVGGTAVVTVTGLPTATINGATTICANTATTILFSGTPNATVTYTINGGANQAITLDGTGNVILSTGILNYTTTYVLSAVTSAGTNCSQVQSGNAVVTVYAPPVISVPDTLVNMDANSSTRLTIAVAPSPGDGYSLAWSPDQHIDLSDSLSPLVNPSVNTFYTVMASSTSVANCSSSVSIDVVVLPPIEVPNVFSPNGDGQHDTWYIKNLEQYPNAEVWVFGRYGQVLFQSQGNYTEHQWDGTYNASPVPIGAYYYIVKLNSGTPAGSKPFCGWVAVVR